MRSRLTLKAYALFLGLFLQLTVTTVSFGHDLFLRPEAYEVNPGKSTGILVFDGTFDLSVFSIPTSSVDHLETRGRNNQGLLSTQSWETVEEGSRLWKLSQRSKGILGGVDLHHTSSFDFTPPASGSHVLGLTLREFRIALSLKDFSDYLESEAVNAPNPADFGFTDPMGIVKERFTKTAKTLIQVGDTYDEEALMPLGMLVEIVPLTHPAKTKPGETLNLKLLEEGKPLPNHSVMIGRKMNEKEVEKSTHAVLHSDESGIVKLPINHSGVWWIKFILLRPTPENDTMDFYSRWASLTFEIK